MLNKVFVTLSMIAVISGQVCTMEKNPKFAADICNQLKANYDRNIAIVMKMDKKNKDQLWVTSLIKDFEKIDKTLQEVEKIRGRTENYKEIGDTYLNEYLCAQYDYNMRVFLRSWGNDVSLAYPKFKWKELTNLFKKLREEVSALLQKKEGTHLDKLQVLLSSDAFKEVENTDLYAAEEYRDIVDAIESAKVSPTVKQALAKKLLQMSGRLGDLSSDKNTIQSLNVVINKIIKPQEEKAAVAFEKLRQEVNILLLKNEGTRLEQLHTLLASQVFTELENIDKNEVKEYRKIVDAVESAKVSSTIKQALAKKLLQMSGQLGDVDSDKNTIQSLTIAMNKLISREEEKASEEK